jgi:hypothetical protein
MLESTTRSQEGRILALLQEAWPAWTPAPLLAQISLQYSARMFSLRRKGWLIENQVQIVHGVKHGSFRLAAPNKPVEGPSDVIVRGTAPTLGS